MLLLPAVNADLHASVLIPLSTFSHHSLPLTSAASHAR